MQLCGSLNILWHCPSWVLERKLIFSSLVAIVVFQIHWHIECNALTRSSLGIWNSSAGFLSPPLALFIVMLPKVHLTSHSRMSGSKQVTTPSWLSRSWRLFFFCIFLCIFATSSQSLLLVTSLKFLSFIMPILPWNIPLISPVFLKRSLVFPILLFSSIYLHC